MFSMFLRARAVAPNTRCPRKRKVSEGDVTLLNCHQRRALGEDDVQLAAELIEGNEDGGAEGSVVRGDRPVAVAADTVPDTVD
jgi:hypothetical protein